MTSVLVWLEKGGRVLQVAIGLVLVQTLLRAWMLLPSSYWQDDFVYLKGARETGLTADYIFQTYNGHLMPAGFLLNWFVAQFPGSFVPAAICILVMQILASMLLLAVMRRSLGDNPAMLVGFAIYLFTPLALAASLWWAAATQAIPLQIAMCAAAYAHLRYRSTGSLAWLAGSGVSLALGFAFWEKSVVIPVFLVLVTLLVHRGSSRETLLELWRLRWAWLVQAVVALTYTAVYVWASDLGSAHVQSVAQFWTLVRLSLVDTLLVGIVGGPWRGDGLIGTAWPNPSAAVEIVCLQILLLIGIVGYLISGARSLLGWLVLTGFLAVDIAITAWGRGYWGDLVGRDPRYISDALPVIALVIGFVLAVPTDREHRSRAGDVLARPWSIALIGMLFIFNSSLFSNLALAEKLRHDAVRTYVEGARQAVKDEPGIVLYDGVIPPDLMIPAFGRTAKISTILNAYAITPVYNVTTERMSLLTDSGEPRDIQLAFSETATPDDVAGCGAALSRGEGMPLALSGRVKPGTWVLRMGYFTGSEGTGRVEVSGRTYDFRVRPGLHNVYMVVPGGVSSVDVTNRDVDGVLCVANVAIGFPIPGVT